MTSRKWNKAYKLYNGFKGSVTIKKVFDRIPEELAEGLTAKQIAQVALIAAKAYEDGKASTGAEMIDNNAVYINSIDKIIEWNEEGAEFERQTVAERGYKVTKSVKVKDGVLVPKFSEC